MRGQVAAQQLDQMWDGWADALSRSHQTAMQLVDQARIEAAHAQFKDQFLVTIKQIYSEAAVVSPQRFAKTADWGAWVRHLYALSIAAEKSLRAGSRADAARSLEKLRGHFYKLAADNERRTSADYIYAFNAELIKDKADFAALKILRNELDNAPLGRSARNDANAYERAKTDWARQVDAILANGATGEGQLQALRAATATFYRAYGRQIE